jgi:hypothetical protein
VMSRCHLASAFIVRNVANMLGKRFLGDSNMSIPRT